jgi:putative sporulation protein YtaF
VKELLKLDFATSLLLIAALTFASSVDNLGIGLSYGIRKIRISHLANLWISVICFLLSITGIYFGIWIAKILPQNLPEIIGAALLTIIGIYIMLQVKPQEKNQTKINEPAKYQTNSLKKVMNDPTSADFDNSKNISFFEATILGIALSANALTNGIGAGLLGFSPVLISFLAALGSFAAIWAGCHFGIKLTNVRVGKYNIGEFGVLISGMLLLLVDAAILFW